MERETRNDLGRTARLPVLREEHLEESELLEFSNNLLEPGRRSGVVEHLDMCPRCREVLSAMHSDGGSTTKLWDPLIGQPLGEYLVERALSRGGMGVVYRGVQPVIGKKVAIKVLLPDVADASETMHRLLTEARAVNAIHHPNIIDIFSFGSLPDGRQYFVMELLDGKSLDALLMERGKLKPTEVITVLDQVLAALGAAHPAGVVHRDLKPANIFVTTLPNHTWHVTVLDFGLAKRLGASSSTSPNVVMGTPGYMAPEQIRSQQVTPATDLYALAVVAWVLLTGQEPFRAASVVDLMMMHLEQPLPALRPLAPDCPGDLVRLVERMLEKRPEARPGSALEVQRELARIRRNLEGKPTITTPAALFALEDLVPREFRSSIPTLTTAPRPAAATADSPKSAAAPVSPESASSPEPPVPAAPPNRDATPTRVAKRERKRPQAEGTGAAPPAPSSSRGLALVVVVLSLVGAVGLWRLTPAGPAPANGPLALAVTPSPIAPAPVNEGATRPTRPEEAPGPASPTTEAATTSPEPGEATPTTPTGTAMTTTQAVPVPAAPAGPANTETIRAALRRRLSKARTTAAQLISAPARRMMNNDLDRVETKLQQGDEPRAIGRELDEIIEGYRTP